MSELRLPKFFEAAIKFEASDIIIKPLIPVKLRIRGSLKNVETKAFEIDEFNNEIKAMLTDKQWNEFQEQGSVDLAYDFDDDNRFRLNIFKTRGRSAIAARRVNNVIMEMEDLHLPSDMRKIAEAHEGLVMLCGVTGSGKSTTIASMLQHINRTRACHIVTLEDPIEYMFKDDKAVINQREIGVDCPNFDQGLRALVRENPDVVLVGEMRDRETFQAALQAAETGHLVFGTIHASSCAQTFTRLYDLFRPEERENIRTMLSHTLNAIVYQRLLKTQLDNVPRVPGLELMLNTPIVKKYILEGREGELGEVIKASENEGMIDYHNWLVSLVEKEYIHPRVALDASRNPDELRMRLRGMGG